MLTRSNIGRNYGIQRKQTISSPGVTVRRSTPSGRDYEAVLSRPASAPQAFAPTFNDQRTATHNPAQGPVSGVRSPGFRPPPPKAIGETGVMPT